MRVDGERVPRHAVAAGAQATDAELHHVAAYAAAAVDARSPGAAHLSAAELGFEPLGEIEGDRPWRTGEGAAHSRACVVKEGVGVGCR